MYGYIPVPPHPHLHPNMNMSMCMSAHHSMLQAMERRLLVLEERAAAAEKELASLKQAVGQIKPVHIDHINYKVQELTVSELSGTLNVGLTALSDPSQLEQWMKTGGDGDAKPISLENLHNGGDMQEDA